MKHQPHNWTKGRWCGGRNSTAHINYPLCLHCGLLWLKNDVSMRAAKASCQGKQ